MSEIHDDVLPSSHLRVILNLVIRWRSLLLVIMKLQQQQQSLDDNDVTNSHKDKKSVRWITVQNLEYIIDAMMTTYEMLVCINVSYVYTNHLMCLRWRLGVWKFEKQLF